MSDVKYSTTIWEDAEEVHALVAQTEELLNSPETEAAAQDKATLAKPAKAFSLVDPLASALKTVFIPGYSLFSSVATLFKAGKAIGDKVAREKAQDRLLPYYEQLTTQYAMLIDKQQAFIVRLQHEHNLREDERMQLLNYNELLATTLAKLSAQIKKKSANNSTDKG